jgi:hypothetical protein
MVIVVQAILAVVADVDVRPAVVIVVANRDPVPPAVVRYACLHGYIGKGAVMIIAKERRLRRGCLAGLRVISGTIHEIDIQPAVVVIVQQADTGAHGTKDVLLADRAHRVVPRGEARLLCNILENHRAILHKASGSNGAVLIVEHSRVRAAGFYTVRRGRHTPCRLRSGNACGEAQCKHHCGNCDSQRSPVATRTHRVTLGISSIGSSTRINLSPFTSCSCCTMPLGQRISMDFAAVSEPSPK